MIGPLLLAAVVLQNPLSPEVSEPEGWRPHYWSSAGHGTGCLLGPHGEEIIFSGYTPTGAMAITTGEADPRSLLVKAMIDRRRVDVAVREDGFVVVSFPSGRCFDFWTHTKTARQAAKAVSICLTRLEVLRTRDREASTRGDQPPIFRDTSAAFPFLSLGLSDSYYWGGEITSKQFSSEDHRGETVFMEAHSRPNHGNWEDRMTLLGQTIRWGEDRQGRAWAAPSNAPVTFFSSTVRPEGTVLAILMAITYRRP